MTILGVTGGYAMGKTTISKYLLQQSGAVVFDADREIHQFYTQKNVLRQIKSIIPQAFLNGVLDKNILSQYFYSDTSVKRNIETLLHALLKQRLIIFLSKNIGELVILDIPLLFEANFNKFCTKTITVHCHPILQEYRALHIRKISREKLYIIRDNQMPSALKILKSDYNINTGGSKGAVRQRLKMIIDSL